MVAGRQGKRHDHQATAVRASRRQATPGHRITLRSRVPAIVADDEGRPTWHRPRQSPCRRVQRRSSCKGSAFIACQTVDITNASYYGRWHSCSALVPRYEIIPHCGVPIFFHGWQQAARLPNDAETPSTSATALVPSHPPSWGGSSPDWSSQQPFLAQSWLWFAQLFCKFSQQDTFATDQDHYRAGSAGFSSNQS